MNVIQRPAAKIVELKGCFAGRLSIVFGAVLLLIAGCARTNSSDLKESNESGQRLTSQGVAWSESLDTTLEEANGSDKVVLIDFSGIEWCAPCQTLRKQVFDSEEFGRWAETRVLLVEYEVPKPGAPRSAELAELLQKYDVGSFPTVHFLDQNGESIGSIPGAFEDPDAWIKIADTIIGGHAAKRD